jgi:hypothetical protein
LLFIHQNPCYHHRWTIYKAAIVEHAVLWHLLLMRWLWKSDHVYSFENYYKSCCLMTYTVTVWPTVLSFKVQQLNLDIMCSFKNKKQCSPQMNLSLTFWLTFIYEATVMKFRPSVLKMFISVHFACFFL